MHGDESVAEGAAAVGDEGHVRVAYIMSRFPKITETFILFEMLAVEQLGVPVEIYPLLRERTKTMHPEAVEMVERARFAPLLSWQIVRANLGYLRTMPRRYLSTLWTLMRANFGSARYFFGALAFFPKAVFFAHRMDADGVTHVHAHFASHPAAVAFVIGRLTGIPYSFTAHGSDLHRDRHMLREKVAGADFVATVSEFNRRLINRECDGDFADKVTVIHCGVDTELFRPLSSAECGDDGGGALRIACVGTLHEVKGQAYLVEACGLLAARGVDFVCDIVGDGPDMAALVKQARKAGVEDRIRFHGKVMRDRVVEVLRQADVVVAPSVPTSNGRREGIPVALMEAAASGIPVIGSRITGVPELVADGEMGYVLEPRDTQGLADALARLADDTGLRARMGMAARDKAVSEFDQDTNAGALAGRFTRVSFQ